MAPDLLQSSPVAEALLSDRGAADRVERMGLYSWLIGHWEMDVVQHLGGSQPRRTRGEVHAGWVLQGRAIQDVWIVPARDAAGVAPAERGDFYGTTLRIYDPGLDAWHILWADPVRQFYRRQLGRAHGRDIVQDGEDETGTAVRWRFTEITDHSFHWLGERAAGDGWELNTEFFARRVAA